MGFDKIVTNGQRIICNLFIINALIHLWQSVKIHRRFPEFGTAL
jgi:hypothetical protein